MIAHIFKGEGAELALRDARDTEIKPGAIVLALHVWLGIAGQPQVEAILEVASLSSSQIAAAKVAAKHNTRLRNLPARPLRVRLQQLLAVGRNEGWDLLRRAPQRLALLTSVRVAGAIVSAATL